MKNYLVMAGIAVAVFAVGMFFVKPVQNGVNQLGAVSSPDINSPYFSFGGVRQWAGHTDTLNQASTTICSLQSPAATSTLRFADVKLTTGTTTAIALEMAKDTTPSATTTRLGYIVLGSGDRVTLIAGVASTTSFSASGVSHTKDDSDLIFAPNTYLNVKYGAALGALNVLVGSCNAIWAE